MDWLTFQFMISVRPANSAARVATTRKGAAFPRSYIMLIGPQILMLALVLSAPAMQSGPAPGSISAASTLFKQARFREAASSFRASIEKTPSAEAYSGLVRSLLKADDVKAADESSQKALAALPESALAHAARGDVYFRRGMIPQSEDEYRAALKLDDQTARAWLGQGKVDSTLARRSKSKAAIA